MVMKKTFLLLFCLVIFLFSLLPAAQDRELQKSSQSSEQILKKFKCDLKECSLSAGWVCRSFSQMDVTTFTDAWAALVDVFCHSPWDYFGVDCKEMSDWKYQEKLFNLVDECLVYDFFLTNLFVSVEKSFVVFCPKVSKRSITRLGFKPIFEYWQSKNLAPHNDFYAFCFDQLFALLVYVVQSARLNFDNKKEYSFYTKKARAVHNYLKRVFERIRLANMRLGMIVN